METALPCCFSPVFLINEQRVGAKLFGQSDRGGFARIESGVVRDRGRFSNDEPRGQSIGPKSHCLRASHVLQFFDNL
jgi:hypothetical protein